MGLVRSDNATIGEGGKAGCVRCYIRVSVYSGFTT